MSEAIERVKADLWHARGELVEELQQVDDALRALGADPTREVRTTGEVRTVKTPEGTTAKVGDLVFSDPPKVPESHQGRAQVERIKAPRTEKPERSLGKGRSWKYCCHCQQWTGSGARAMHCPDCGELLEKVK